MPAAKIYRRISHASRILIHTALSLGKPKIFCIGKNKTGTTSLARALTDLGIPVGEQFLAEHLIHDWARRDFRRLSWYCQTAQAFQDVPFSLPFTFQAMDQRFPGSKFILTVRDTPEQWYQSLIRFHAKIFGHGQVPTLDDLKEAAYVYKGWAYEANRLVYSTPTDDPYNKDVLILLYETHNNAVLDYFQQRPADLLVLNVAETGAYNRLFDFIGKARTGQDFPWENKTAG